MDEDVNVIFQGNNFSVVEDRLILISKFSWSLHTENPTLAANLHLQENAIAKFEISPGPYLNGNEVTAQNTWKITGIATGGHNVFYYRYIIEINDGIEYDSETSGESRRVKTFINLEE